MRDYYRRARDLYQFAETLLARAAANAQPTPPRWFARPRRAQRAELFVVKDRHLHLDGDATRLAADPLLCFAAVELAQAAGVAPSHDLRAALMRHPGARERAFRHSPTDS